MKLESFHEARFNFFLSSVEADPADFEEFVDHERSKRFPEGAPPAKSRARAESGDLCHARTNTVHPTWKPDRGLRPMALIIECESFVVRL